MEQEFFLSKGRLGSDKQNALDAIWLVLGRENAFGHKGGGCRARQGSPFRCNEQDNDVGS